MPKYPSRYSLYRNNKKAYLLFFEVVTRFDLLERHGDAFAHSQDEIINTSQKCDLHASPPNQPGYWTFAAY